MTDRPLPKLIKWPFFVADAVLLLLAWWIMAKSPQPFVPWPMLLIVVSVIAAFGFAVWPYVLEYQAALKHAESADLTDAVAELGKLQSVADQIRLATGQWQTVHEHSGKAVTAAKEISERMTAEAKAFAEFMQKANDSEKGHLRLETEKLRRNEGEWLQLVVRLLDHVYALYQAGARSGQPNVREQLGLFQTACRDVVRRIGLVPVEVVAEEPFDASRHQVAESEVTPTAGALVAETLATGYTFQGQVLRLPLVRLKGEPAPTPAAVVAQAPAPAMPVAPPPVAIKETKPLPAPRAEEQPDEPEPIDLSDAAAELAAANPDWSPDEDFRLEPEPPPAARPTRPRSP